MFSPLPAQTVFEARLRSQRNTRLLFISLLFVYLFFLSCILFVFFAATQKKFDAMEAGIVFFFCVVSAFFIALFHFYVASNQDIDKILAPFKAYPADPSDQWHSVFINIVHEAEAASGIRPIRAVIIPIAGLNAFSIMDMNGKCAIGITEGLLTKLNRPQLSAVIAHETAHLIHQDSRVMAIACSLFSVFDVLNLFFSGSDDERGKQKPLFGGLKFKSNGRGALVYLAVYLLVKIGTFISKMLFMAISRNREYLADASGVNICKDPLSLAEALDKIAHNSRGGAGFGGGFSALFIVNPQFCELDEHEGFVSNLFSTHPPTQSRQEKLMKWAKRDVGSLQDSRKKEESLWLWKDKSWKPLAKDGSLAMMGLSPLDWVASGTQISRAADVDILKDAFLKNQQEKMPSANFSKYSCPRCQILLYEDVYEGAVVWCCDSCHGYLVKPTTLSRIIIRDKKHFAPAEIQSAQTWRSLQKGTVGSLCSYGAIHCPVCKDFMSKIIYSENTKVVVDICLGQSCQAVWCDNKELDNLQILIQCGYQ